MAAMFFCRAASRSGVQSAFSSATLRVIRKDLLDIERIAIEVQRGTGCLLFQFTEDVAHDALIPRLGGAK